jgi:Ca2+-binding RTX toxin-like protein
MGSSAFGGTGNGFANTLAGNSAASVVRSRRRCRPDQRRHGPDRVDGEADKMTGGYDAGTFVLRKGEIHGDVVTDFGRSSSDKLVLSGFSADITVARLAGSSTDWAIVDRKGTVEMVRFTDGASGLLAMNWILT